MASLIDWDLAASTAKRLSPPPPPVARDVADAAVIELRAAAEVAAGHVAQLTGLNEPPITALTRVVDRDGWIDANAGGMATLMGPLIEKLAAGKPSNKLVDGIGGKVTGAQAGALLAFMSGKVLGQFEFFARPEGQLMLVAPNIVDVEDKLGVDPSDFRLWVCLHEVTHRVQFTAVPWLRQHLLDEIETLTQMMDTDAAALKERLSSALTELLRAARGQGDGSGVIGALTTPEQRVVVERVTAFMSLVEGHAEYVMNAVSADVIPTQKVIEARFAVRRRKGGNPLDKLMRRLLGLDAKTRQYVEGSAFVREVVQRVGLDGFNAVWAAPANLPSKAEIAAPAQWVGRVHG
ncbi:MAG: zinc-dependent metalloprotease [Actinomycetota bacterium]|nr:zinc-dependent metalloprotease [Actinomycetota bacterium]